MKTRRPLLRGGDFARGRDIVAADLLEQQLLLGLDTSDALLRLAMNTSTSASIARAFSARSSA